MRGSTCAAALVLAASIVGCASRARFEGIGYDEAWELVLETTRGRAQVVSADERAGLVVGRYHRFGPDQRIVDFAVDPYQNSSTTLVSKEVLVRLEAFDEDEVGVRVDASTTFRTFYTEFDQRRDVDVQEALLTEITANLVERIERRALAERMAALREVAPARREGMLFVPVMRLTMGADDSYLDARPPHSVEVGPFLVDVHEVTVEAYARFVEAGGYREQRYWSPEGWTWRVDRGIEAPAGWRADRERSLPVTGVSWYEADAYARWAGKRLPTESEWELCARGTLRCRWPWGNFFRPFSNSYEKELRRVEPVGRNPGGLSPLGLHDMAGNANEWCADWYHPSAYEESPAKDPRGPDQGRHKVLRGGSFESWRFELQSFHRDRAEPGYQHPSIGFRCVADVPGRP